MRKHLLMLALISAVYFGVFIVPNNQGAQDEQMLLRTGHDEPVIYPILVHMLTPGKDIHETWWRLIIYGDYHYGYPFYLTSFLTLLPVRLLYGAQFVEHTQLNLLLLRQIVSVLPMVFAAGLLTYLQTRFKSAGRTILLFCLLLSIPGVVRNNIRWWHPDALAVLAVVLTLFFLDRDRLRFGRNFWLAAAACGMAVAIKLVGVYFFLAIAAYLAAGILTKKIGWWKAVLLGCGFTVVMAGIAVGSNPYLFYPSQRAKFMRIQAEKQVELDRGYTHDDPAAYQKGPGFWQPTLNRWYGEPMILFFLSISLLFSCFTYPENFVNRLILAWCLPLSLYLLYFVAPKPDHYWLPVMLPLFSAATNGLVGSWNIPIYQNRSYLAFAVRAFVFGILLYILARFTIHNIDLIQSAWTI
mgnify:CR=1 FL=1